MLQRRESSFHLRIICYILKIHTRANINIICVCIYFRYRYTQVGNSFLYSREYLSTLLVYLICLRDGCEKRIGCDSTNVSKGVGIDVAVQQKQPSPADSAMSEEAMLQNLNVAIYEVTFVLQLIAEVTRFLRILHIVHSVNVLIKTQTGQQQVPGPSPPACAHLLENTIDYVYMLLLYCHHTSIHICSRNF